MSMKVTKLNWISKSGLEAELTISDGTNECLAFSQPCSVQLNYNLQEPLHALEVENLMKIIGEDENENIVKTNESYFSHYCIAKVESVENSIVSIGDILIKIEERIPGWAKEGDLVEFKCARLDIW